MITTEPIAQRLQEHQASLPLDDWQFADCARELHRWVEIVDSEFKLRLPNYPVLQFDYIRRSAYATYAWFRNQVGTKDNITFNVRYLRNEPAELIATLTHELLHLWQHYYGRPGRNNYHNRQFREKAEACGILVSPEGCHTGYTTVFTGFLEKYGSSDLAALVRSQRPTLVQKQPIKMKKWCCACTTVRCAIALSAQCLRCGRAFVQRDT